MNIKYTHILLELGQIAALATTVLTMLPTSHAPTWVPSLTAFLTAFATWAKQHYGNTPQNAAAASTTALFEKTP